eukprot:TRINITY_DN28255_c0_g1_i3.p1 TRINITY_DN28255_c0_g1~~TRINITY_DN28255_c0_g1_i3.p1  ORF type:complete len:243 (+),score=51.89 TRINITY_DN28255_c0_g1_i3:208-936(+)
MSLATPTTLPTTTAISSASKQQQQQSSGVSSGVGGKASITSHVGSWRSPSTTSPQLSSGGFISPNRSNSSIGGGSSNSSTVKGDTGVSASISPNRSSSRLRGLLTQVSQDDGQQTSPVSRNTPNQQPQVTGRGNSVISPSPSSSASSALPTIGKNNGSTGSFSRRSPPTTSQPGASTSSSSSITTFTVGGGGGGVNRVASPKLSPLLMDVNGFQVTAEALRIVTSRKKNGCLLYTSPSPRDS